MSPNTEEVRQFYNEFLSKRMIGYRVYGNMRIESAAKFFADHIRADSTVVDVGCGIGIASEMLAKRARSGMVIGVDISDMNIWYARKTVRFPNVQFHTLDIGQGVPRLRELLKGKSVDVFTLGDVIEHLTDEDRAILFRSMAELGSPTVKLLITIPSEFYQRYLIAEHPEELQIIDNIITPTLLEQEGRREGFVLTYFRVVAMWHHAQYAHCILERDPEIVKKVRTAVPSEPFDVMKLSKRAINKLFIRRLQYKKYVTDVFADTDKSS
jgi:trans-aconitate 2-methyltransferase